MVVITREPGCQRLVARDCLRHVLLNRWVMQKQRVDHNPVQVQAVDVCGVAQAPLVSVVYEVPGMG